MVSSRSDSLKMDDFTFTFVSLVAATGGAIGTLVGYNKLRKEREQDVSRQHLIQDNRREENSSSNNNSNNHNNALARREEIDRTFRCANDFARTIGYLGMHSLYGMVVYGWMPVYLLGNTLRRELWARSRKPE